MPPVYVTHSVDDDACMHASEGVRSSHLISSHLISSQLSSTHPSLSAVHECTPYIHTIQSRDPFISSLLAFPPFLPTSYITPSSPSMAVVDSLALYLPPTRLLLIHPSSASSSTSFAFAFPTHLVLQKTPTDRYSSMFCLLALFTSC